ncbi:MAG: hypothetical protein KF764_06835 [Labilithrix sp.]|nr:hypothetical protein [Labilithrix sp.]MBX3219390.1 hypothetical protein [Labilithrix sp.]
MRKLILAVALVSTAALVLGCPLMKKKDDAEADAAADAAGEQAEAPPVVEDAAPPPPVVTAKNAADVARFAAETPVTDDDMKLASSGVARTAPKTGAVVATLKPGTDVGKIAEYQGSVLVTFADPKDASTSLMGWIVKESFTAPAVVRRTDAGVSDAGTAPAVDAGHSAPKKLTCPMGMVAVVLSAEPLCRKKCAKDSDCKGGAAGACANASTAAGSVAKVCVAE